MTSKDILNSLLERAIDPLGNKWKGLILSEAKSVLQLESLLFTGPVGVGKTHQMVLLYKKYLLKTWEDEFKLSDYPLLPNFINFYDLVNKIKDFNDFTKNTQVSHSILTELIESPALFIDDLDTVHTTEFKTQNVKDFLYRLFDFRYNNNLLTIATTNRTSQELASVYGEAITDRIAGIFRIVKMAGVSKRLNKKEIIEL